MRTKNTEMFLTEIASILLLLMCACPAESRQFGDITSKGDITATGTTTSDGAKLAPPCTKTVCSSTTDIRSNSCDYITDGTADDVQINAAIAAVVAGSASGDIRGGEGGKGSVCLTEGSYTVASPIGLRVGVNIYGQGITSTEVVAGSSFNDNIFEFVEPTWDQVTGTISTSGSSTTITGSSTAFLTDFLVGDWIATSSSGANARKITAIASDTSLTVNTAVTLSSSNAYNQETQAGQKTKGIFIDCNTSANTSCTGINGNAGNIPLWDLQLEDVYIFEADTQCVHTVPWGFRFFNSHCEDSAGKGINIVNDSDDTKKDGAIVMFSKIIQTGDNAITLNDASFCLIIGNELHSNTTDEYAVEIIDGSGNGGDGNIIVGNKFNATGATTDARGVLITDSDCISNVVSLNTFSGLTSTAEIDDSGTNTVISGNRGDSEANTDHIPNAVVFGSTVENIRIKDDDYAFFADSAPSAGLYFGASTYQFKNASGTTKLGIGIEGHIKTNGSAITLTSCGTSPTIAGNDTAGLIAVGSGTVTTCQIDFADSFVDANPICLFMDHTDGTALKVTSRSATSYTIGSADGATSIDGDVIAWLCMDKAIE